jgi:predicted transcriptional regulator
MNRFIVAEVTKNWDKDTPPTDLISQKFEAVINVNHERGYKLIEWKYNTVVNGDYLTELIIAIFQINDVPAN